MKRSTHNTLFLLFLALALIACGDDDKPTTPKDGGADTSVRDADIPDAKPVLDAIVSDTSTGNSDTCPTEKLSLRLIENSDAVLTEHDRIVAVWTSLNDDLENAPPQVIYDQKLDEVASADDGNGRLIEIPLNSLEAPAATSLNCARSCDDAAACDCEPGTRKMSFGFVAIVHDKNQDGRIDLTTEARDISLWRGEARSVLVYADREIGEDDQIHDAFIGGTHEGICPYDIADQEQGFDKMEKITEPQTFDLNFCEENDQTCLQKGPNLA